MHWNVSVLCLLLKNVLLKSSCVMQTKSLVFVFMSASGYDASRVR